MSAATYTSIDHLGSSKDVDKLLSLWFGYNHNVKLEPYGAGSTSSENDSLTSLDETEFLEPEDPIVIVGMACRLPGNVASPKDFWEMLLQEKSGQCEIPKERFNIEGFYHPESDRAGLINTRGGYFLQEDVRQFDNEFFGINNIEAMYMDPQQRKLLEVVYECFESSGTPLEAIAGANVGVYVGNFTVDFQTMQARDADYLHRYSATGSGTAILSNRVSHVFDLRGPSFTLDTACSSSIYCLHNAVTALENAECDAAVVAGANLITSPEQHLGTMKGGVLSPTSACHTFDASADGYGRAEGVGALYLKRLSAAITENDHIYAVIRATAVNSNGKTPGISQPSVAGQAEVIRKAYRKAGLDTSETSYVECHGTGTALGDPIEVEALGQVFPRSRGRPLLVGAVKTNLGHSEAASGISAIIKTCLAFEYARIPATIGITRLNPKIPFKEHNFEVVRETIPWPSQIRRASINSFGYGGANAHVILESPDSVLPGYCQSKINKPGVDRGRVILPLSASSQTALRTKIVDISNQISRGRRFDLGDLTYTLAKRRSMLTERGFVFASQTTMKADFTIENLAAPERVGKSVLPICFVFTGQGSQWPEMGKELFARYPLYKRTIDYLDKVLMSLPEAPQWTLQGALCEKPLASRVGEVEQSQPLCTAVQIGLVKLLRDWGVKPSATLGHSSGEIAAAYTAGMLTAAQAITIAYYRGHVVSSLNMKGRMLVAGISAASASEMIKERSLTEEVTIACINSPENVTLSGTSVGISKCFAVLQDKKLFVRKLHTGDRAYHSHLMKVVGVEYENILNWRLYDLPQSAEDAAEERETVPMFSSVGGDAEHLAYFLGASYTSVNPEYWRRNLELPVHFLGAMTNMIASGKHHIIEVGPHSALQLPIKQIWTSLGVPEGLIPYDHTLVRGKDSEECLKTLAGRLYLRGHRLDFLKVNGMEQSASLLYDLPPYPWHYNQLLWNEPRSSINYRNRQYPRHELLGAAILAQNGLEHTWVNKLKVNEVPWLEDHKLQRGIVFPAAGYLAMIMEAMSQVQSLASSHQKNSFIFRNVAFRSLLIVTQRDEDQETFTTLSPQKLSVVCSSSIWYDFSICSLKDGQSTMHCSGTVSVESVSPAQEGGVDISFQDYDEWSMTKWYEKLEVEGLHFGPSFRTLESMKTAKSRRSPEAISVTKLLQRLKRSINSQYPGCSYPVHPLSIDSCLQASIMGSTGGNITTLKAHLPNFMAFCRINAPNVNDIEKQAIIQSSSRCTGFGTKRIDVTLRGTSGETVVDIADARLAIYEGRESNQDRLSDRHPCLSIVWKPDLCHVEESSTIALINYLQKSYNIDRALDVKEQAESTLAGLLDLMTHKNPELRVLELRRDSKSEVADSLVMPNYAASLPRTSAWHIGNLGRNNPMNLSITNSKNGEYIPPKSALAAQYDAMLLPDMQNTDLWRTKVEQMLSMLKPRGSLLLRNSHSLSDSAMRALGLTSFSLPSGIVLARRASKRRDLQVQNIIVIEPSSGAVNITDAIKAQFQSMDGISSIKSYSLHDTSLVETLDGSIVISLLEMREGFLPHMSIADMQILQQITKKASQLVWLTGSTAIDPNLSLSSGLSRALALEQPALDFIVCDIGIPKSEGLISWENEVCQWIATRVCQSPVDNDKEFFIKDGLVHISRFVPANDLNTRFRQSTEGSLMNTTLEQASPARLAILKVGLMDTIYFRQEQELSSMPPADFVDVEVKAVSLNAKDIYVLSGKVETKEGTSAIEFSGVVKRVGPAVIGLGVGDRVVVLAPTSFRTTERVPAWACQCLLPGEDFVTMPTLPVIYGTALYAVDDRARLRPNETILIHSGAGAFGMAAIAIALRIGATVFTTVSTDDKKDYLAQTFSLPRENILQSRNASFVGAIQAATNGRGVDVIINSLTEDLLHASWACIASFGRFVEVGKRDIVNAGRLSMEFFSRNATFTAFDLTELYYHDDEHYRSIWVSKFKEALRMYRAHEIKPVPIRVFDVSEITQAYRYFSNPSRIGKVVISLQSPDSLVRTVPLTYAARLDSEKSYILVGCLGGLGRSLSRWMLDRGARSFVFLGRSGCDKPSARALVQGLRCKGAIVKVVRGDVLDRADVDAAVASCPLPIGGIVQAAMGLQEALFTDMTHAAWHKAIQPKFQGTWNIHNALEGREDRLDFFLLTSSVSGSVGTATESNYCAANAFLDAFARYRRNQGKKACSIGLGMISEVGYLHENPDIEALLLRKGIQALTEREFLQIVDLALTSPTTSGPAPAHILTGLESQGMHELLKKGFDVSSGTTKDPRAAFLAASLSEKAADETSARHSDIPAWSAGLPPALIDTLSFRATASTLAEAVLGLVRKRFSSLILVQPDKLDDGKPLIQYGIDSMIAAEFRSWFWSTFKVDVPFADILSSGKSLSSLAALTEQKIPRV